MTTTERAMPVFFTDAGKRHLVVAAQHRHEAAKLLGCHVDQIGLVAAGGYSDGGTQVATANPRIVYARAKKVLDAPWEKYHDSTGC